MLRTCSRMAVLRDGEKVGELEESELSQSNIMKAIAGGDDKNEDVYKRQLFFFNIIAIILYMGGNISLRHLPGKLFI